MPVLFLEIDKIIMKKSYMTLVVLAVMGIASMAIGQSLPSYVPTNGLVGWWGFNGNAQDGSGNGNHGTVNGATLTADRFGNPNKAYSFDGLDDIIEGSLLGLTNTSVTTVSAWVKYMGDTGGRPYDTYFQLGENSSHTLAYGYNYSNMNLDLYSRCFLNPYTNLNIRNQWHHIVVVDSFQKTSIYIDGNYLFNFVSGSTSNCYFGNNKFYIGGNITDLQCVTGSIDDIAYWNVALTPQEITSLYNAPSPNHAALCLPTISTISPISVGVDSVVIGGDIANDGGSPIVLRGICYSTTPDPNMGSTRTEDGSGIGSFNTVLRGLSSSTTYYARSYAKNSSGVVVYGNEVSFTTSAALPGLRCPGTPTVTDIDGNSYYTVQIGNQCWSQSNHKSSRYRNGDSISTGINDSIWSSTTSGAYSIYNNDPMNDGLYGKLYNHYAVMDSRGLCPTGWHVPSDADWTTLENQLGGPSVAGGALKSTAMQPTPGGWASPNTGATNSSGFTAPPGGLRNDLGVYYAISDVGYWWTSSVASNFRLWVRGLDDNLLESIRDTGSLKIGISIRCLKNTLPQVNTTSVSNVTPSSAVVTGEVISEGDQNTSRGFCYSTTTNPTISNDTTMNGSGLGAYLDSLQNLIPLTTYYVRAYVTNSAGTSYGNEVSFTTTLPAPQPCSSSPTVTDIDGNVYNTVQIGNQCWTQTNLKTTKYRNGDNISTGLNNSQWEAATYGAYGEQNLPGSIGSLGRLYNHFTVSDSRGLCPTGWKVPSIQEWLGLANYLGGSQLAGGILKDTLTQPQLFGWDIPNVGATNQSGFAALGSGFKDIYGNLGMAGTAAFYWSSSAYQGRINASWIMSLFHSNTVFSDYDYTTYSENRNGFSVRCLKD
ncbi:MAG: FISUMP domain-containing protein [Bacteroidota bacterium]|jgi:uncharacterized protein (TIGR02145 family)